MLRPIIIFGVMSVIVLGCAQIPAEDIRTRNASNLQELNIGMTKRDVTKLMGTETTTVSEEVFYQGYLTGYRDVEVPQSL